MNLGTWPATLLDQRNELRCIGPIDQNNMPCYFLDCLRIDFSRACELANAMTQGLVSSPHGFQRSLIIIAWGRHLLCKRFRETETRKKGEGDRYFFHQSGRNRNNGRKHQVDSWEKSTVYVRLRLWRYRRSQAESIAAVANFNNSFFVNVCCQGWRTNQRRIFENLTGHPYVSECFSWTHCHLDSPVT